jgi:hypothetical protein
MSIADDVELEFNSWEELVSFLVRINSYGWIFRGLSNYGYSPFSKLERTLNSAGIPEVEWRDRENFGLAFFKERARHLLKETPRDNDLLGWLTFMQHYGAPTRLTDWTVSPFVACYFALNGISASSDSAALWMLNASACRSVMSTAFPFGRDHMGVVPETVYAEGKEVKKSYPGRGITDDHVIDSENLLLRIAIENESAWPIPLPIIRPDQRMTAQQACFVASGKLSSQSGSTAVELLMKKTNSEEIAQRFSELSTISGNHISPSPCWMETDEHGNTIIKEVYECLNLMLKKIRLPYIWRVQALKSLAMMNIAADTLFPGLDGAGRATELFIQLGSPVSMRQYLGL